ncbi:MAG: type II toxin-antitoxin system VapC family toxin, partial [Candidatus Bathyarchaeota archaeon]|nr:type II toxin-antitoxin system VapC family toxin [Candidatus Bathyarchaeota archaeon]
MGADAMRILDADILAYALYDESPAHSSAWQIIEKGLKQEFELNLTHTTILETYNTLFWFYRVRPLKSLLKKLSFVTDNLKVIGTSLNGLKISESENIPLGDGFLIATALQHSKPIIVTNDSH